MKMFGRTDTGKVRSNNQDSFRVVPVGELMLGVVCDGMGGAAGGSLASSTACDEFVKSVSEAVNSGAGPDIYEKVMRKAVDEANAKVFATACNDKSLEGMGTTVCAVLTDGKKLWAVSVGDSRIYMFKNGEIFQVSHDHSYVQVLIDSGKITKEESRSHPNKNIITRAVGTQDSVECDSYVMNFDMDGILLCSDGLSNFLSDSELNALFGENANDIEQLTKLYIDGANSSGGGDNITALVVTA